jgi:glycosyltransferase involved in cell wall biosynthesis
MTEKPLISIALCTYNGERFLKQQLDSLIQQTYKNIEIVIVDDCSSDQTYDILQAYAEQYPIFHLHKNETQLGYNRNFEKALKLCAGELIAICDQDDIWRPDKIEIQQEAIKDNLLVYCDSILIDGNGESMNYKITDKLNFHRGSSPEAFLFFNCVSGHTILLKRKLLCHIFPFPANHSYDQWLGFAKMKAYGWEFVLQWIVLQWK